QLFVAQLALLLEQRTAQHTLRRQSSPSGLAHPLAAQIARHQTHQPALAIQPLRDRLQLAADLVPRKHCEYSRLERAFLPHWRLRRCGLALAMQWLAAATYPKPPGLTSTKSRLSARFQKLSVYGQALV